MATETRRAAFGQKPTFGKAPVADLNYVNAVIRRFRDPALLLECGMIMQLVASAATLSATSIERRALLSNGDRRAIRQQSHRLDRAFEMKRSAAWSTILAPNFRSVAPGGTMTGKAAYIGGVVAEANSAIPPVSVQIRYAKMERAGKAVLTEAREHTCYGLRRHGELVHRLCYSQRFAETWRKAGKWQLQEIRYFPDQTFVLDGKLVTKAKVRSLLAK